MSYPVASPGAAVPSKNNVPTFLLEECERSVKLEPCHTTTRKSHRIQLEHNLITSLLCIGLRFQGMILCVATVASLTSRHLSKGP